MADNLSQEDRKKNMSAIRAANTRLEEKVTKELWRRGLRFRKNIKELKGKPDIAVKKRKLVIFIDSCFWHGCPIHGNIPETNKEYWSAKLERNKKRDIEVNAYYIDKGWNVLRIWEHDIKEYFPEVLQKIIDLFKETD